MPAAVLYLVTLSAFAISLCTSTFAEGAMIVMFWRYVERREEGEREIEREREREIREKRGGGGGWIKEGNAGDKLRFVYNTAGLVCGECTEYSSSRVKGCVGTMGGWAGGRGRGYGRSGIISCEPPKVKHSNAIWRCIVGIIFLALI
eukprot:CFRG3144T1